MDSILREHNTDIEYSYDELSNLWLEFPKSICFKTLGKSNLFPASSEKYFEHLLDTNFIFSTAMFSTLLTELRYYLGFELLINLSN